MKLVIFIIVVVVAVILYREEDREYMAGWDIPRPYKKEDDDS